LGVNFIAYSLNKTVQETPVGGLMESYFFPNVWHTVSWLSNFTLFLPGVLIILMITNELLTKPSKILLMIGVG
jgi:hypothetical protein